MSEDRDSYVPLPYEPPATPSEVWIQFADNGNIRKWQREPFEGATCFKALTLQQAGEAGERGE